MLNIGHRGAMGHAPENTLLSIHQAIEQGADWVEIDVHYVHGQLLVIHDGTLDRTTNGVGPLAGLSFNELRRLDAGQGEQIPTLEEVIHQTAGKVGLNIELKGEGTAAPVVQLLATLTAKHRETLLLSSFSQDELETAFQLNPNLKLGVLLTDDFENAMHVAEQINAFSIHLNLDKVTSPSVMAGHEKGLRVFAYTVNEESDIQRMKILGVDGVFTNFPNRVSELACC